MKSVNLLIIAPAFGKILPRSDDRYLRQIASVSPEINALSTIMIAVVTVGVITASLVTKSAMMRQRQDEQAAARTE